MGQLASSEQMTDEREGGREEGEREHTCEEAAAVLFRTRPQEACPALPLCAVS